MQCFFSDPTSHGCRKCLFSVILWAIMRVTAALDGEIDEFNAFWLIIWYYSPYVYFDNADGVNKCWIQDLEKKLRPQTIIQSQKHEALSSIIHLDRDGEALTTANEPIHHPDESQDNDIDGGRVFGSSMSKRQQDTVGTKMKMTKRTGRSHTHHYVSVVLLTTTGTATKRGNGPRNPYLEDPFWLIRRCRLIAIPVLFLRLWQSKPYCFGFQVPVAGQISQNHNLAFPCKQSTD